MPSSELLNDLTSEPISRRTLAAGLWAAPVIALTAAAPAFAASGATLTVTPTTSGNNPPRQVTVNRAGTVTITVSKGHVQWGTGAGTPTPAAGPTTSLSVVLASAGTFTFLSGGNATGTVTFPGATAFTF